MPLLNYTTSISPTKTIMEIQAALAKAGASASMANYDREGNIVSLSFRIMADGQEISFRLPTAWEPVQQTLKKQRVSPKYQTPEQALRVAWRITKDWVEGQLAIIETQMVTTAQVFLPYAITNDGSTVWEYMAHNPQILIGDGKRD
ncbi:hypothetical protein [Rhodococcoides kyotonense]|uniref:Uncharacterized protein n=1 Tax=Rhodococcoides kyotonense TaxID=398843 RepID=A0A239MWM9_9NOCA|nr:hypothetical protein [Rhodococcus kyotonensis]SNT46582.1 hypothetical protein SAMN05421642_12335 [Rhodococcus kyotonensis]